MLLAPPDSSARDALAAKAQRGKEAMAASRFEEAVDLYREIVKALPNEPGMRLNLGMAESMAGHPRAALPHFRAAVKLKPDLMPAWLFLGATHMELGEPAPAVAPLQKVVAAQPENVQARQMLAEALLDLQRWEAAALQFRALADRAREDPRAWHGLGRSYEGLLRASYDALTRAWPESPYVLLLTADALATQGKHANAFRLYREAAAKQPRSREPREALAKIYERTGHVDWAATEREEANRIKPPNCRARPDLECAFRSGRYAQVLAAARPRRTPQAYYWSARAAQELALQAFARLGGLPPSAEAALLRAQVLDGEGRHVEAAAELRQAVQSWPGDARLRRELATSLHRARDFDAARPLLEELVQQEPGSAELAFMLGDTYLQQQQAEKAVAALESALAADPGLLPARAALGRAWMLAGDPARALPHLEAARDTDEDGSLHYQLSRAYQARGESGRADAALRRSQELRAAAQARERDLQREFTITPP
ncbi:MAG TPA: tetratricopeptide repeat protein [Vicinamibacteria bacterium]